MKEQIVFDDWLYRPEDAIKRRKKAYFICFIPVCILNLMCLIGLFFSLYVLFCFALAIWVDIVWLLEYLKIKNQHLVITEHAIYVTDRFHVTKKYLLDYKDCSLELKQSVKRGGGVWLKFYDKNGQLLLKYEDMLNRPARYDGKILPFGEAIKSLQIPLADKDDLFRLR